MYIYVYIKRENMSRNNEEKLTSVKLIDELYKKFREKSIRDDFSLQKLVNRSIDLFVHDEEFAKTIKDYDNLEKSGSKY